MVVSDIPNDILVEIFLVCDPGTVQRLRVVCMRFKSLIDTNCYKKIMTKTEEGMLISGQKWGLWKYKYGPDAVHYGDIAISREGKDIIKRYSDDYVVTYHDGGNITTIIDTPVSQGDCQYWLEMWHSGWIEEWYEYSHELDARITHTQSCGYHRGWLFIQHDSKVNRTKTYKTYLMGRLICDGVSVKDLDDNIVSMRPSFVVGSSRSSWDRKSMVTINTGWIDAYMDAIGIYSIRSSLDGK